jgi:hypothetical protein
MVAQLGSEAVCQKTHSQVEELINREGTELMRRLYQAHLSLRARQEREQGLSGPVMGVDQVERAYQRDGDVGMMTVFGPVRVERISYQRNGVESLQPLEAMLNVPNQGYSLGVRRRVAQEAAKSSFEEVVTTVKGSSGAQVPKRQAQELTVRAAADFEAFYNRRAVLEVLEPEPGDSMVVLSADGKGVVMRRKDLLEATRRAAEMEEHKLTKRLSKGEKKNRKRMATVAAVYTIEPHYRTPEDIVSELAPVRLIDPEAGL